MLASFARRLSLATASILGAAGLLATAGAVETLRSSSGVVSRVDPTALPVGKLCAGDTVARIAVDRLSFEAPVREGVDDETLFQGPGHVPGTALPGEESGRRHAVIALARDRVAPFANELVLGDEISVRSPVGLRTYRVVRRRTIPAAELAIGPTERPTLTLIAPYPPDSIGPAPLRLAVTAELVGESSSSASSSLTRSTERSLMVAGVISRAFAAGR